MPTAQGPKESVLQKKTLAALRARGGWWQRKSGHSPYESSSVPDIYGCYRGRFVAFELKRPGARRGTTRTQELTLIAIGAAEGVAYSITSLEEVITILNTIDDQTR